MTDYTVVFIGEPGSGKTHLIRSLKGRGLTRTDPTQSSEFGGFHTISQGFRAKIWDLPAKVLATFSMFIKKETVSYLCLDLTLEPGVIAKQVKYWTAEVVAVGGLGSNIVLLGTKADKILNQQTLDDKKNQLIRLAQQYNCCSDVFITSAVSDTVNGTTNMDDVFSEAALPADIKEGISRPIAVPIIVEGEVDTTYKWRDCLIDLVNKRQVRAVSGVINLSVEAYKVQLKIMALLKFRNKEVPTELNVTEFDPVKIKILALIDARIEKIEGTWGVFKNKSPEKVNAWLHLYELLYLEPNVDKFRSIIEDWGTQTQIVNGETRGNLSIIGDQRANAGFFESKESQSLKILALIKSELPADDSGLTQEGLQYEG